MTRPVYCDESIWLPVAEGLANRGWETRTARGQDLLGAPDREQLRFAVENDWILLTFDDDFLGLVEAEGMDHTGIIYVNQANRRIGEVVKRVDRHLQNTYDNGTIHYL